MDHCGERINNNYFEVRSTAVQEYIITAVHNKVLAGIELCSGCVKHENGEQQLHAFCFASSFWWCASELAGVDWLDFITDHGSRVLAHDMRRLLSLLRAGGFNGSNCPRNMPRSSIQQNKSSV